MKARRGCFIIMWGLLACSSDPEPEAHKALPNAPDAGPPRAPAVASNTGCTMDADCQAGTYCFQLACAKECETNTECAVGSCSSRGRCETSPGVPGSSETLSGATITRLPDGTLYVRGGEKEVKVNVGVSGVPDGTPIAYRIARADDLAIGDRVWHAEVRGGEVTFPVAAGSADPALPSPEQTTVLLHTSLRTFRLQVAPALPAAGRYRGRVLLSLFGREGVPIEVQVVTRPARASLADAESARLVLPVAADAVFSPHDPYEGSEPYVAAALERDPFTGKWVAKTTYEYRTSALPVVGPRPAKQVERSLRFELEQSADGRILGTVSDRWQGLFNQKSPGGTVAPGRVNFAGSLELVRYGDADAYDSIASPTLLPAASPQVLPAPGLEACSSDALFVSVPEPVTDCAGITSRASYEAASSPNRVKCALAMASGAVASSKTLTDVLAYIDGQTPPSGLSFAQWMERCAAGTGGTCVPSSAIACSRALVAHAHATQPAEDAETGNLLRKYLDVSREAFLGPQLAALSNDTTMRRDWLLTRQYPSVLLDALEDWISGQLDTWRTQVLDVQLGIVSKRFDTGGLALLTQVPSDTGARDARRRLLLEMAQSWRASSEGLSLAARRWNELYRDSTTREARAKELSQNLAGLYVLAGIVSELGAASGEAASVATVGSGFGRVVSDIERLRLPFDRLLFARDAEVVESTSLDPLSSTDTVLRQRQTRAEGEVEGAARDIDAITVNVKADALSAVALGNELDRELDSVRRELVQLCGLPAGCTTSQLGEPRCAVATEAGRCGFSIDATTRALVGFEPGTEAVSEAGRKLLSIAESAGNVRLASEELYHQTQKMLLAEREANSFAQDLEGWNLARTQANAEMKKIADDGARLGQGLIAELSRTVAQKSQVREQFLKDSRDRVKRWDSIRSRAGEEALRLRIGAAAARTIASIAEAKAGGAWQAAQATADSLPKVAGAAVDPSGPARAAAYLAAQATMQVAGAVATAAKVSATALEQRRETVLGNAERRIEQEGWETEVASYQNKSELEKLEDNYRLSSLKTEEERKIGEALMAGIRRELDADLAYARDRVELRRLADAALKEYFSVSEHDLRRDQATLQLQQRTAEYLGVVQRAELLRSRLDLLASQRAAVNDVLGSPEMVFASANQLLSAENRLQRARSALFDWLVAIEYFAVRPFIDHRLKLLLATNHHQLRDIAKELADLQDQCGGPVSRVTATVSVRDDLLALRSPVADPVTQEVLSPGERFRRTLREGLVQVDTRVRYTTDSTLGSLMSRPGEVLSASFPIRMDNFSNLATTCNAKVSKLSVELVGVTGTARPTVTLLYDGTSQLRSCQPGIDAYVAEQAANMTSFGAVSHLRTPARTLSPIAGIGAFPPDSDASRTLEGLPLASRYTLLIDTSVGENRQIDWSKLEDVRLKIEYGYQDLFPAGRCE